MQRHLPTHWTRNNHIFVIDGNWQFTDKLKGHALVIYAKELNDISRIIKEVQAPSIIHAIVYENYSSSLASIEIDLSWKTTPIILKIGRLGQFRDIAHKIDLLKSLNVMVVLPANSAQCFKDSQLLSSLGIHSGVDFSRGCQDWDSFKDLVAYAFYGRMPHAEIEPFSSMATNYCGMNYVTPAIISFYNPEKYIHIDPNGNLAFSREQLYKGDFFSSGWELLPNISTHPEIKKESHKWQQLFIDNNSCTFCPAFRVCSAYFVNQNEDNNCRAGMLDLLEAIEYKKAEQSNRVQSCQL